MMLDESVGREEQGIGRKTSSPATSSKDTSLRWSEGTACLSKQIVTLKFFNQDLFFTRICSGIPSSINNLTISAMVGGEASKSEGSWFS